jgi:hypothetical protein
MLHYEFSYFFLPSIICIEFSQPCAVHWEKNKVREKKKRSSFELKHKTKM